MREEKMPSAAVWTSGIVNVEHSCSNYFNIQILNHYFPIPGLFLHQIQLNNNSQDLHVVRMNVLQLRILILVLIHLLFLLMSVLL